MRALCVVALMLIGWTQPAGASSPALYAQVTPAVLAAMEPTLVMTPPRFDPQLAYLNAFRQRLEEVAARDYMAGLAVAVIDQGELVMVYTAGEVAAGSGEPVTDRTLFRAASVSKGMTGTLMALLEHEGRLSLDESVPRELLPLPHGRSATAVQVLAQRTGLVPHALDRSMERGIELYDLRNRFRTQRAVCRPGTCYSYQNVTYTSLETLGAQAAGLPFEQAMRAWLFERIGMPDATVGVDDLVTAESWARPHRRREREDGLPVPGDPESAYDATVSAAGVNISLRDMIAYAQAHLGISGRLPRAVIERVQTSQGDTPEQTRRLYRLSERIDGTGYGLGWRSYDWNGRQLMTHSGYLSGYGAQIYLEPATGFAYVGLWNADGDAPWWLFPTLMDLRTGDGPGDWIDRLDE
ncbi:serine hydrolase domain-containing protein [Hyphobacterium sp.]|jgi:beta-lactamase class C|uniref:serine hydrolase domain-containing protein n=1 Tax=Hyphobacterium sp. TaxID=2004662 RepID=UPI003BAB65B4